MDLQMSSNDLVLQCIDVSKRFELYSSPADRLLALLTGRSKNLRIHQALKPISFSIRRGGFLGIIGQNGSGKSTLLQIIAGIVKPSSGQVQIFGRIAALLELGAGFNPEFTGRENAKLNAQILGISDNDFVTIWPEIQQFADIGEFIDQPVKLYSSGMFVRLAFAVQACVEPDILIIDEALAVGDIFFRLKCYERLERLRKNGCTVILVTHSMEDIIHHCDQALLLHKGEQLYLGDPTEAINRYYALGNIEGEKLQNEEQVSRQLADDDSGHEIYANDGDNSFVFSSGLDKAAVGDGLVQLLQYAITDYQNRPGQIFRTNEQVRIHAKFVCNSDLSTPIVGVVLRTDRGVVVFGKNTAQFDSPVPTSLKKGSVLRVRFDIDLSIAAGEYLIDLGFATWPSELHSNLKSTSISEIESASVRHCVVTSVCNLSVIPKGSLGYDAQPFYGLTDLRSDATLEVFGAK
jgi:lipopolysaccharide transport system ATP-binding protein